MNLQTMKQRAREELHQFHLKEYSFQTEQSDIVSDKSTTQTYRDTLNIALAGIVDRKNAQWGRDTSWDIENQNGFNQANATHRAFLQKLLDEIKD
jgi:hypothetical protein